MAQASAVMQVEGGAGDASDPHHPKTGGYWENYDHVESRRVENVNINGSEDELVSVYRSCSVEAIPLELRQEDAVQLNNGAIEQLGAGVPRSASAWSLSRVFQSRLFQCCRGGSSDNENSGIELEDFYGIPDNVDQVDVLRGNEPSYSRITCTLGPTVTVDCSNNSTVDAELQRLRVSVGDAVRKLVARNGPVKTAMKMFMDPLICENITFFHMENGNFNLSDLCVVLANLQVLQYLNIEVTNCSEDSSLLVDDFNKSRGNPNYFNELADQITSNSTSKMTDRLKVFRLSLPLTWQCGLVCKIVKAMSPGNHLQELRLKSSIKAMISYLISCNVEVENEGSFEHLIMLEAEDLIRSNRNTLKHLSLSCADTFPLEYLRLTKSQGYQTDDIYRWCFLCTLGVLRALTNYTKRQLDDHLLLPNLTNLHLDLPLLPIPQARDDDMRKPLNMVAEFMARNPEVHIVSLHGLRPVKGMENWIRNSLITIPKYKMGIGCTYTSSTIASNLTTYDDELQSLGLEIVADEPRDRIADIIDPTGGEVVPNTWRYSGMRYFHLVNQLPTLKSYDLDRIAQRFTKLTKLVIEDFTGARDQASAPFVGSLLDQDMKTIFNKLVMLEYLHLDCNMDKITDRGITGMQDSVWSRLLPKSDKIVSFWQLCNLKYVFMRGLGNQVTDKSAIHAFSEEYSLKKLQELHVFAPGFTNYGREKIRRAYAGRNGFVLEV